MKEKKKLDQLIAKIKDLPPAEQEKLAYVAEGMKLAALASKPARTSAQSGNA